MSVATLDPSKIEVQKQWDTNPCGAEAVTDLPSGTLDFYRAIRDHRYNVFSPAMSDAIGFDRRTDLDMLEVGVGLGSDHFRWASAGNRMTALDLSREHLKHATNHLQLEGLSTKANYGDAEHMPFDDASFDFVYSFGVLHHTPNTEASIDEVHRVLRPGGKALIGLYHQNSIFYWFSTIFVQGIVKAGLLRKSYRRLVSEIEYRDDSNDAMPLVKVYSRSAARRLFGKFSKITMTSFHVEPSHFSWAGALLPFSREQLEKWLGRAGWMLMIEAEK